MIGWWTALALYLLGMVLSGALMEAARGDKLVPPGFRAPMAHAIWPLLALVSLLAALGGLLERLR